MVAREWYLDYVSPQSIKFYNKAIEHLPGEKFIGTNWNQSTQFPFFYTFENGNLYPHLLTNFQIGIIEYVNNFSAI